MFDTCVRTLGNITRVMRGTQPKLAKIRSSRQEMLCNARGVARRFKKANDVGNPATGGVYGVNKLGVLSFMVRSYGVAGNDQHVHAA